MAKCFITGMEVPIEKTYLMNLGAANQALKDMRRRVASLERMIEQLGANDDVEKYDVRLRTMIGRRERRLVCETVANAMAAVYPEKNLFIAFQEWRRRKEKISNSIRGQK